MLKDPTGGGIQSHRFNAAVAQEYPAAPVEMGGGPTGAFGKLLEIVKNVIF